MRTLQAEQDGSVVICSVGALSNLAELCRRAPGLVRAKVRQLVVMGGQFPAAGKPETNIATHPAAAVTVASQWPTEIVWQGFEIGDRIITGAALTRTPVENPVRRAYELRRYQNRPSIAGGQPSYDQAAALYAVRGPQEEYWEPVRGGWVRVDAQGLTRWEADPAGRHVYLRLKSDPAALAAVIEPLMVAPPKGAVR
jgi:inosine-uridine nucleoside N-ribohydrolase